MNRYRFKRHINNTLRHVLGVIHLKSNIRQSFTLMFLTNILLFLKGYTKLKNHVPLKTWNYYDWREKEVPKYGPCKEKKNRSCFSICPLRKLSSPIVLYCLRDDCCLMSRMFPLELLASGARVGHFWYHGWTSQAMWHKRATFLIWHSSPLQYSMVTT